MEVSVVQQNIDLSQINTTGIRIISLFSLLLESPKSCEEINSAFLNNPLIRTQFSDDTIRNDINTLRNSGCRISRALKTKGNRYVLLEHPFELDLKKTHVDAIKRVYSKFYQYLSCEQLVQVQDLFEKLAYYSKNQQIKDKFLNISILKFIDKEMLKELLRNCYNKNEITISYKSSNNNVLDLEIITDEIRFRNGKLYLFAYDKNLKKTGFYKLKNIQKIVKVNLFKKEKVESSLKVKYKLLNTQEENYLLSEGEKIIGVLENDLLIEASVKNEFIMIQNILNKGSQCVVIEPKEIRDKIISTVNEIRELYNAK